MKRALVIAFLSLACLVLAAVVVLGVLLATLNPNDYKKEIAAAVTKATGRELVFEGDLKTSFFPSLALKTGRLRLEGPPGFGQEPFVSVDGASFSLALAPLFSGRAKVEEVRLDGVTLNLVRASDGRANWKFGTARPEREGETALQDTRPPAESGGGSGLSLLVDSVKCSNLTVVYRDMIAGASYEAHVDDLSLKDVGLDKNIPIRLNGSMTDATSGAKAVLSLAATARMESTGNAGLTLDKLEIATQGPRGKGPTLHLKGTLHYSAQGHSVTLEGLKGSLDDASFEGTCTALLPGADGPAPGITHDVRGTLRLGTIDADALMRKLDVLMPPAGDTAKTSGAKPPLAKGTQAGKGDSASAGNGLYADIQLDAAKVVAGKLPLTNISARLVADKGTITVAPFSLKLFEGSIGGNAGCDLRAVPPAVHAAAVVSNLPIKPLLQALAGKDNLAGTAGMELDVQGKGLSWNALAPTLNGRVKVAVTQAEVHGFDLLPANLPGLKPIPADFPVERLSASGVITKGVLQTRDILLLSPVLKAQGGGSVDLARSATDLSLDFLVGGLPPAVPFQVKGPFSSLSYGLDTEAFLKNTAKGVLEMPDQAGEALKTAPEKAGEVLKGVEGLFR